MGILDWLGLQSRRQPSLRDEHEQVMYDLFGEQGIRDARRQRSSRDAYEFKSVFGFDPANIVHERCQLEAMLKLAALAASVMDAMKELREDPSSYQQSCYNSCVKEYFDALELLGKYDPQFAQDIPHWTKLPAYLERIFGTKTPGSRTTASSPVQHNKVLPYKKR